MRTIQLRPAADRGIATRGLRIAWPLLLLLSGCGTTQVEPQATIPLPLVARIPVVIGIYVAPEFRDKVYREKREGMDVAIAIGKAQSDGFTRLMSAMFDRAVPVDATDAGARTDPQIRGVLEPVLEDFSFVTPSDSGSATYAVSLRYKVNGYTPEGKFVDSWSFTGYGAAEEGGMLSSSAGPLQKATQRALRDAGARLAAELREQALVRGLLPASDAAPPAPVEVVPPKL